jgi:mannitol/fructose-specific phosphotransferase system IIA component (Ntr-type)
MLYGVLLMLLEMNMKLSEMFKDGQIIVDFKASNKKEVLGALVDTVVNGFDRDSLLESLYEREELGSTGIGHGVAVPHIRLDSITEPVVAFGKSSEPVEFDALDDEPCSLFFLIVGPTSPEAQDGYLQVIAKISRLMRSQQIRDAINAATTAEEVINIFTENER